MASLTLQQLLSLQSEDEIRQQLLSDLNANGFPVTDWQNGAVMKTTIEMLVKAYSSMVAKLIPKIAAAGFLTEADDDWLRALTGPQMYEFTPQPATFTIQQATLTCDAANGPYTIAVGTLTAKTTAGRRYTNITGGVLATSGTLSLQWQSEGPNDSTNPLSNYIDGAGTMTTLVTPKLGVTINNPAVDFTPVTLAGVGPNQLITVARTVPATAPTSGSILIKITMSGQVGAATFSYRKLGINSDPDFVAAGPTSSSYPILGTGATLTFVNGAVNPSFNQDDLFAVSSPGGPIITQGRDEETSAAYISRCMLRWPSLSSVMTLAKYELFALTADPQVVKAKATKDTVVSGRVNVTIGGQVNPLAGSVIANVQNYIDERTDETDFCSVSTATSHKVYMAGGITVPVGQTAAIQALADANWQTYIADLPLGGTAKLAELNRIIGDAVKATAGDDADYDIRGLSLGVANARVAGDATGDFYNVAALPNEVLIVALELGSTPTQVPSLALTWAEA